MKHSFPGRQRSDGESCGPRKTADLRATTRPRDACGRSPSWIRATPSLSARSRFTIPTGLDEEYDDDGSEGNDGNEQHREPF